MSKTGNKFDNLSDKELTIIKAVLSYAEETVQLNLVN